MDLRAAFQNVNGRPPTASELAALERGSRGQQMTQRAVFPVDGVKGPVGKHWGQDVGGTDIFAPRGAPVRAIAGGKVVDVGATGPGGYSLTIQGDDGNQYYFAHLNEAPRVKAGQRVESGVQVGSVGDSGNAKGTGPHLHLGIGKTIRSGVGAQGGTGSDFDAVSYLNKITRGEQQFAEANQAPSTPPAGPGSRPWDVSAPEQPESRAVGTLTGSTADPVKDPVAEWLKGAQARDAFSRRLAAQVPEPSYQLPGLPQVDLGWGSRFKLPVR